jgi:rubrerythrin
MAQRVDVVRVVESTHTELSRGAISALGENDFHGGRNSDEAKTKTGESKMKTENVLLQDVKGIEIRCTKCGAGVAFTNKPASPALTCPACNADISTGILAAQQYFEFAKTAVAFGVVRLRIHTGE